jgi:hypothetical protein
VGSFVPSLLVASLLVYCGAAITRHWWPSAVIAPLVAALLWRRHRRARFTAYVFFSVMAFRGALTREWGLIAYALAAVALMQAPAAARAWPRLSPGRGRGDRTARDDRIGGR